MADHQAAATTQSGMDYREHERTYERFTGLVKWGSIFVATLLVLMAYFLI